MLRKNNKPLKELSIPVVSPNAAGIDVGAMLLVVAVPPDRDDHAVREFGTFTCDLHAIAQWLKKCNIETVAMECTGVYWKNLYAMLIQYGFEVCLVNARHTRNVTGRKTDEKDAQWIQRLHTCGLLSSCFLPDDLTQTLRTLVRHRRSLTQESSRYILRVQKSLEMMNIKIHALLSSFTGKTGTAIIQAIIAGEREPENFLPFIDHRVKADKQAILKSLEGNWRNEHLFLLQQSYQSHLFVEEQILRCEKEIEQTLQTFTASLDDGLWEQQPTLPQKAKSKYKNTPEFNTRAYLQKIHGVDVISIFGISDIAALEILSETGTQLSKWPTENHFVSWLNLCPNNKISGGKLISSALLKKKPNAASMAFRYGANTLRKSDHWLGDYFRRMKSKGGNKYAVVATARKLAIIYYKMVRFKQPFQPFDNDEYKTKFQRTKIAYLERALLRLRTGTA